MRQFLIAITLFFPVYVSGTLTSALTPAQQTMKKGEATEESSHTISKVLYGGRVIELDDGSKWEVSPSGRDKTGGWLGPADVKIRYGVSSGRYPDQILNTWTNSTVSVRKMADSEELEQK